MVVFTLPSVFMIMPMASFYQIDPDGDVDIVLPQPKEVVPYVDDVLDCPATSPRLNISRVGRQEPSEPEPLGEEPEWRLEPQPTAETEPAPVSEALDPDGYPGPATTPERQALAIVEAPSDVDQTRSVLAKEDASSTLRQNCVQIRVSSKHLVLASPYFKRNLGSGMLESHILSSQGHVEFRMDIEDLEAMLIVMNIVHGRTRQVPRHIDLDMLTRVAVLVDYLECHEVIELFSDRWIDDLKGGITTTYSEALIQWLCISLIFRKACQFKAVTHTAIRQTKGPIDTLGLPIRESVVGERSNSSPRSRLILTYILRQNQPPAVRCTRPASFGSRGSLERPSARTQILQLRMQRHAVWCARNRLSRAAVPSSADSVSRI